MQKLVFLLFAILLAEALASYDATVAHSCLYLSYSAYCDTSKLTSWNCDFCDSFTANNGATFTTTGYASDSGANVFGYVGYSKNIAYVVFRGTQSDSISNWAENIDYIFEPYPPVPSAGQVHEGFYGTWADLKGQIEPEIKSLVARSVITQVYFVGHSLGATMAMLGALEVGTTLGKPLYVYTFGEPRVGDPNFAAYWKARVPNSLRVVNDGDIVVHLPPEDAGFQHVPTEVWYTSPTSYKVCSTTTGEDSSCSDSLWFWDYSIDDHTLYLGMDLGNGDC